MTLRSEIVGIGVLDAGWVTFPIKLKSGMKDESGDDLLGCVCFDKNEIYLETKQDPRIMRRTLLHECLHVLLSTSGVKHPDEDVHVPLSVTNEFITEQMTRGLFLLRRLNPELWAIIFEEDE